MRWTRPDLPRALGSLTLACLLLGAALPAAQAQTLSDAEFEERLSNLQDQAEEAFQHYEAGERQAAVEDATAVRDAFTFEGNGSSALENKIKEISAVSIGDQVKAQADRLLNRIEAGEPVEDVRSVKEDLVPSLNRLVLVARGEHAPASQRQLKTVDAIESAAREVRDQVDQAVELYEQESYEEAKQTAKNAFFTYETNGMGPDTSTVDDALENEVENLIQNFNTSSDELGLVGLIDERAPIEDVRQQADRIHEGLDRNVELLKATKPPSNIGDANADGQVTIVDALLTAQAALGIQETSSTMDANQDGSVTIVDALLISQAALGIQQL